MRGREGKGREEKGRENERKGKEEKEEKRNKRKEKQKKRMYINSCSEQFIYFFIICFFFEKDSR